MNGWSATVIRAVTVTSGLALLDPTGALVTVRQADNRSQTTGVSAPSVSGDSRFVAFMSYARLVEADTDDLADVYVLDRLSGRVTIETESHPGPRHESGSPRLSRDGRILVYQSELGPIDGSQVVVVRDRQSGATQVVGAHGLSPNGPSRHPDISADGRFLVWASSATNLVDGPDANGIGEDVYMSDRTSGTISRISVDTAGRQPASGVSFAPRVNADGRYVAFTSTSDFDGTGPAANALPRRMASVYIRDLKRGTTTRVSVGPSGASLDGASYDPAINATGRYVVFVSDATNAVPRDKNGLPDIFIRDLEQQTTTLVSRSVSGGSANGPSGQPAISADGDVAFQSDASDLICSKCAGADRDINLVSDVFLFHRATGVVQSLSGGRQPWMESSVSPAIDEAGTVVAFSSRHPIDVRDVANDFDLFVWCHALDGR